MKKNDAEPFDWMVSSRPKNTRDATLTMRQDEIRSRAGLLSKLGFSAQQTKQRLTRALEWEYEQIGKAAVSAQVDSVVDQLFRTVTPPTGRGKKKSADQAPKRPAKAL